MHRKRRRVLGSVPLPGLTYMMRHSTVLPNRTSAHVRVQAQDLPETDTIVARPDIFVVSPFRKQMTPPLCVQLCVSQGQRWEVIL
jgi:hypothetical protein